MVCGGTSLVTMLAAPTMACSPMVMPQRRVALEPMEASTNAEWVSRAMNERARIYKDAMGQYEKAIALYERINNPPSIPVK